MPTIRFPISKLSRAFADPWPFMVCWLIGGILSILVPVLKWNANKQEYYDSYGYAIEYEQQQRAYEEQQNGGNNNNNSWYNYPQCHWWQYKCRKSQFNYRQNAMGGGNNNDNGNYQFQYPGWFIFFGGETEEDQRWREEQGEIGETSSGALKFVYAWSIVMFVTILFYGCFVLYKRRTVGPLIIMLCMFLQFCLMAMALVCQGVLDTDDRDLEDSVYGFYGQMGVLLVYTYYAYFWFTIVFTVAFVVRAFWERYKKTGDAQEANKEDAGGSYFMADNYEAPKGTMA